MRLVFGEFDTHLPSHSLILDRCIIFVSEDIVNLWLEMGRLGGLDALLVKNTSLVRHGGRDGAAKEPLR